MEKLLFCDACGAFRELYPNSEQIVTCENCDHRTDLRKLQRKMRDTVQEVAIERSQLLHRLYNSKGANKKGDDGKAVIDEECPKCKHPQMAFHTAQLRGVDEGQTIFYTCMNSKCGHKFTVHS